MDSLQNQYKQANSSPTGLQKLGSHQNAMFSKDGTTQAQNSRLPKDSPLLCYPFDLKRQIALDPVYSGISTYLEVIPISDIVSPNIPSLLPKDISAMRLQSMNTANNYLSTALCSIASQEELVYSILGTDAINEEGFYRLTVEDMGERCEIRVGPYMLAVHIRLQIHSKSNTDCGGKQYILLN